MASNGKTPSDAQMRQGKVGLRDRTLEQSACNMAADLRSLNAGAAQALAEQLLDVADEWGFLDNEDSQQDLDGAEAFASALELLRSVVDGTYEVQPNYDASENAASSPQQPTASSAAQQKQSESASVDAAIPAAATKPLARKSHRQTPGAFLAAQAAAASQGALASWHMRCH